MWIEIYKELGLKSEILFYFLLGFCSSFFSIFLGLKLFPENAGIVAVFFTTFIIGGYFVKMISLRTFLMGRINKQHQKGVVFEEFHIKGKNINIGDIAEELEDIIKRYLAAFFGVFFSFAFFVLLTGIDLSTQTNILTGNAANINDTLGFVLNNNFQVYFASFILAMLFELGGIFVVVWNASVWGTIFATTASKMLAIGNIWLAFSTIIFVIFPHTMFEAMAYFLSGIGGGIANKFFNNESVYKWRLLKIGFLVLILGVFILIIAGIMESLAPKITSSGLEVNWLTTIIELIIFAILIILIFYKKEFKKILIKN